MLAFILKYPFQILTALFFSTTLIAGGLASHLGDELSKEKTAHAADVQHFKDVQKAANDQAEATKKELIKESKANAEQADINYHDLLSKYNASILRYKANQSSSRKAHSDQLPTSEGGDGSGTSTFISITMSDAKICSVNTARLQAVRDWAITLPKQQE